MRILLLNPNTSVDMTEHITREASRYSMAGLILVPATARFGGEVIASRASYAIAAHAVLDTYACHTAAIDAVVVACFGDPGLEALREVTSVPVIGLLESAVKEAASAERPFGIVTAGSNWVPMLSERVQLTQYFSFFRGVFSINTTGLNVNRNPELFVDELQGAVDAATKAGAEAVILGGSALAGFGPRLSAEVQLIDPLEAAMVEVQQCLERPASERASIPSVDECRKSFAYRGLSLELTTFLDNPHFYITQK